MPEKPRKKPAARKKTPRRSALVRKALALIERRLDSEDMNTTVADLIRLLEMAEKQPAEGEVKAGFVEPEDVQG